MTTNSRAKRDRHPARSARILTTGIAVASTLGISTALTLAAQASANNEAVNTPVIDPSLATAGTATPTAPSSPAAATPVAPNQVSANAIDPSQTSVTAVVPVVPAAPQVIDVPVPAAPQGGWTAPATSGSH